MIFLFKMLIFRCVGSKFLDSSKPMTYDPHKDCRTLEVP